MNVVGFLQGEKCRSRNGAHFIEPLFLGGDVLQQDSGSSPKLFVHRAFFYTRG
jgi:hypothetical protein